MEERENALKLKENESSFDRFEMAKQDGKSEELEREHRRLALEKEKLEARVFQLGASSQGAEIQVL